MKLGERGSSRRILLGLGLIAWCVGCDQGTKRIAVEHLKDQEPIRLLNGIVQFLYAENTGAWGSLGAGWPSGLKIAVFMLLPLAVLGSVVVHMVRSETISTPHFIACALLVGGGVGNVIDRMLSGYVVDFMWVGVGRLATNIFNVADVAVVVGVILLLLPQRASGGSSKTAPARATDNPSR